MSVLKEDKKIEMKESVDKDMIAAKGDDEEVCYELLGKPAIEEFIGRKSKSKLLVCGDHDSYIP